MPRKCDRRFGSIELAFLLENWISETPGPPLTYSSRSGDQVHSPPTAHYVPSTVHLSWKEFQRIIIMWYAKYNIRQARLVTVLVRVQRCYACASRSGCGSTLDLELDTADGLPEMLALELCDLELERGRLAGAVGASKSTRAPRGAWRLIAP